MAGASKQVRSIWLPDRSAVASAPEVPEAPSEAVGLPVQKLLCTPPSDEGYVAGYMQLSEDFHFPADDKSISGGQPADVLVAGYYRYSVAGKFRNANTPPTKFLRIEFGVDEIWEYIAPTIYDDGAGETWLTFSFTDVRYFEVGDTIDLYVGFAAGFADQTVWLSVERLNS